MQTHYYEWTRLNTVYVADGRGIGMGRYEGWWVYLTMFSNGCLCREPNHKTML